MPPALMAVSVPHGLRRGGGSRAVRRLRAPRAVAPDHRPKTVLAAAPR